MTAILTRPTMLAPPDLAQLYHVDRRRVRTLTAIERPELPDILAAAPELRGVVHHHARDIAPLVDEHLFVAAEAAVKAVLWFDGRANATLTTITEIGRGELWARIDYACTEWEHAGRHIPDHWARR